MALTIASREVDGVTVLDLSGRITLGEGSVQLRDAIRDLISKGQKSILLNLGDVNYIDSSGLGELVSAYTTAKNQGAALKLLKPDQKGQGRAAADQALHRLRHLRRRSQRHRLLQVDAPGCRLAASHPQCRKAIPRRDGLFVLAALLCGTRLRALELHLRHCLRRRAGRKVRVFCLNPPFPPRCCSGTAA